MAIVGGFNVTPEWPYILCISFGLATAYAALISHLNGHRRYGAFWRAHAWLEVVVGDSLIALTIWALAGLGPFLLLMAVNVVFGIPMILGELLGLMHREERRDEQDEAARIAG